MSAQQGHGTSLTPSTRARAILLAWWASAIINTVLLRAIGLQSFGSTDLSSAAMLHLYDVGLSLTLGLVIAGLVVISGRWVRQPRLFGWAVATIGAVGLGMLFLREDLQGPATRMTSGSESVVPVLLLSAGMALSVPVMVWVTRWFARGWLRVIPLVGALGAMVGNHLVLRGDYAGAHLLLGTAAACVAGAALTGLSFGQRRGLWRGLSGVAVLLVVGVAVFSPPNRIVAPLAHSWARGINEVLPHTVFRSEADPGPETEIAARPASEKKAQASTTKSLLPENPIIIYYSVDSMRADLLDTRYAKWFPHIHALKKDSLVFSQARAPSTRTTMTLTTVMTGKYAAQLFWSKKFVPEGKGTRAYYVHKDKAVHFPEILAKAGVSTVQYGQAVWLANEFRMTAGFTESVIVPPVEGKPSTKGKWSTGEDVIEQIFARLRMAKDEKRPLFLFFHDLDPHSPFDLGRIKKGSTKRRYLSEVKLVDSRIGRLRALLEKTGLDRRTVFILTADHGEGFGEHGVSFHGQTLYDEQLRVPLLIRLPGQRPRVIDDYVSLIDLGPTILDLMGQPTPPDFLGQSLGPYFLNQKPTFTRPLIGEVRAKESLLLPNGLKLIRDRKTKAKELYDLKTDPKELKNIFDERGPEAAQILGQLGAFFKRHELRRKGYTNRMKR